MKRTILALSLLCGAQLFAQSGGLINGTRGFPQPNDATGTTISTLVTISTNGTAIAATTGTPTFRLISWWTAQVRLAMPS